MDGIEKTGIQALERKHPDKPTRPGQVEKREFEYDRHGTQALIAGFEVATGKDLVRVSLAQTAAPREFPVDHRPA